MLTLLQIDNANKGALREACREAGIAYTTLNLDAMRDALRSHVNAANVAQADSEVATAIGTALAAIDGVEVSNVASEVASMVDVANTVDMLHSHSSEGANEVAAALLAAIVAPLFEPQPVEPTVPGALQPILDLSASVPAPTFDASYFANIAVPRDPRALFAATKPVKVEKVRAVRVPRAESNGVKQPSLGTLCREVWSWCDVQCAAGIRPEAKALRAALAHIDPTTCTVQYYRWRKFNGISGR